MKTYIVLKYLGDSDEIKISVFKTHLDFSDKDDDEFDEVREFLKKEYNISLIMLKATPTNVAQFRNIDKKIKNTSIVNIKDIR